MERKQHPDRRIQRTRLALREALIDLMTERGWDETNIRDLCERANVGRSTFYQHFQSKEELLVGSFDDLRIWLTSHAVEYGNRSSPMPFVRGLIEHVQEQRALFHRVIGRRSGHVVQKRFREIVIKMVKESGAIQNTGWQLDATASYIAGALVELLAWWVDSGTEQSVEEIEEHFFALTTVIYPQR